MHIRKSLVKTGLLCKWKIYQGNHSFPKQNKNTDQMDTILTPLTLLVCDNFVPSSEVYLKTQNIEVNLVTGKGRTFSTFSSKSINYFGSQESEMLYPKHTLQMLHVPRLVWAIPSLQPLHLYCHKYRHRRRCWQSYHNSVTQSLNSAIFRNHVEDIHIVFTVFLQNQDVI